MLKALRNCLIILSSIILLSTSAYAVSNSEFIITHEDRIIAYCEDNNLKYDDLKQIELLTMFLNIPGRYECAVTQFYALRKNTQYQIDTVGDEDNWEVLKDIMVEYFIMEFDTFDFISINLEFENYLEEMKDCE